MWIRSARWDGVWILSGLPAAFVLYLLMMPFIPRVWFYPLGWFTSTRTRDMAVLVMLMMTLQTGHLAAPIVVSWARRDVRRRVLMRPLIYIALPILLVGVSAVIGWYAPDKFMPLASAGVLLAANFNGPLPWHPFVGLALVYAGWNAYHFAMQNFGVLSIYRVKDGRIRSAWQRQIDKWFCLAAMGTVLWLLSIPPPGLALSISKWGALGFMVITAALAYGETAPRAIFMFGIGSTPALMVWWPTVIWLANFLIWETGWTNFRLPPENLWVVGVFAINHWLVAIGLSARIWPQALVLPATLCLIGLGTVVFCALFVVPSFPVVRLTMVGLSLRIGLGFSHFIYDGGLWKMSDPEVRATIGKELFA